MPDTMPTSDADTARRTGLREWVDHALMRSEISALRPLCILTVVLMGAAALVDVFTLTQSLRPWVLAHDLVSMTAAGTLAWTSRSWKETSRWIRPSIALVALLLISNTILTLAVSHDMVWRFLRREGQSFKKTLFAAEQNRADVVR